MVLMSDFVLYPTFPDKEVDRVRNDRLTAILQQRDSPFQTAIRVMQAGLYGPVHPYGHVTIGTSEALRAVKRDDLVGFYKSVYSPSNAALVLAGDLTEAEAHKLASDAFGTWSGSAVAAVKPSTGAKTPDKVLVVDKPEGPQTAVLVGQVGVTRADPDYEKLNVMNQVLGGLFTSRLNLNLREQKGWTYGAFSFLNENRGPGPIVIGASVEVGHTGPSIGEMLKETRSMLAAPVSPEELTRARESISRSLPAMFETTSSTVGTIGSLYLYDQPPDYYESLPARLGALTAAEVFSATKAHLKPESLVVVAVGDRRTILPQIAALKLGPVGFRDLDGKPLGEREPKAAAPLP